MGEVPLGERVAALEARMDIREGDGHNVWAVLDDIIIRLEHVDGVASSASGRMAGMDVRVMELEKREAVSKHQMNLIIGTAGAIAAAIGALAVWVVRDFVWPAVQLLWHKG